MPIRFILRYLMNNERLVQRLSDSWPVRWAARRTANGIVRSLKAAEELARSEKARELARRSASFRGRLKEELRKGFEEMNRRNQK